MNWITNKGQEIPICELRNSHLVNILRFLKRQAIYDAGNKSDWRSYVSSDPILFGALLEEAENRNLNWDIPQNQVSMYWTRPTDGLPTSTDDILIHTIDNFHLLATYQNGWILKDGTRIENHVVKYWAEIPIFSEML